MQRWDDDGAKRSSAAVGLFCHLALEESSTCTLKTGRKAVKWEAVIAHEVNTIPSITHSDKLSSGAVDSNGYSSTSLFKSNHLWPWIAQQIQVSESSIFEKSFYIKLYRLCAYTFWFDYYPVNNCTCIDLHRNQYTVPYWQDSLAWSQQGKFIRKPNKLTTSLSLYLRRSRNGNFSVIYSVRAVHGAETVNQLVCLWLQPL